MYALPIFTDNKQEIKQGEPSQGLNINGITKF